MIARRPLLRLFVHPFVRSFDRSFVRSFITTLTKNKMMMIEEVPSLFVELLEQRVYGGPATESGEQDALLRAQVDGFRRRIAEQLQRANRAVARMREELQQAEQKAKAAEAAAEAAAATGRLREELPEGRLEGEEAREKAAEARPRDRDPIVVAPRR